jgi:AbrB family looped-hinge helix DNA binding protein
MKTTVSSKGQIVLPAALRERDKIRPGAEQEIDDVPFVRLQPVERRGGNRADVQAVDVVASVSCWISFSSW